MKNGLKFAPLSVILLFLLVAPGILFARPVERIDSKRVAIDSLLWDLNKLSEAPAMKWLDEKSPVRTLVFDGCTYKGKPTKVFAYYSNPDLINRRIGHGQKFPGVILAHGGGGKAFKAWVEKWAAEGYAALAVDFSGTGGDQFELATGAPLQSHKEKFDDIAVGQLRDMWTYHAVADIVLAHSLLLGFDEVDAARTAITGISWGGYLTCLAASIDNRFKVAAPVYGCGFYNDCTFREDLNKMTETNRLKWLRNFDPANYLRFAQPPFLFINGNKDGWFFVEAYHKTYSLIAPAQRTICIKPDMIHSHQAGWEPGEIKCFFESVMNSGCPLPKVAAPEQTDSLLVLPFDSRVTVTSASFVYTTDADVPSTKRLWKQLDARIEPQKQIVSCVSPRFKIGFFVLKDVRNLTVSSPFIFNNSFEK